MFRYFYLYLATATLGMSTLADAQAPPLSPSLMSNWVPHIEANLGGLRLHLIPPEVNSPALPSRISATINCDSSNKTLNFHWRFRDDYISAGGTGASGHLTDSETVSFTPTAFTQKKGADTTIFVAGYNERTGHVVVEKWDFSLAIGITTHPVSQEPIASLAKSLQRTTVISDPLLKPLHSIAYSPCSDRLWLFEAEAPYVVSSIDPDVGPTSLQYIADANSTGHSYLASIRHVDPMMVSSSAPDGGGFVFVCMEFPIWELYSRAQGLETEPATVLRDSNCDGTFDITSSGTYGSLVVDSQYDNNSEPYYN